VAAGAAQLSNAVDNDSIGRYIRKHILSVYTKFINAFADTNFMTLDSYHLIQLLFISLARFFRSAAFRQPFIKQISYCIVVLYGIVSTLYRRKVYPAIFSASSSGLRSADIFGA